MHNSLAYYSLSLENKLSSYNEMQYSHPITCWPDTKLSLVDSTEDKNEVTVTVCMELKEFQIWQKQFRGFNSFHGWVVSVLDSRLEGLGSSPGRVIALCSWARHFSLTVPLSTQVYNWVPAKCQGKLTKFGGITCDGLVSHPGRVAILYSYLIHATKAGISSGCVGRWFGLLIFFTEQF